MDEKISIKALEDYSDDCASKLTANFFADKERIAGAEITRLCEVHQVNLFVLRELSRAWKLESQKLRSPYFDYNHPAVADALTKFNNLLSNHISISRESFQPLLKKAIHQTLYLILDPYDFFAEALDRPQGGSIRASELKEEIRFIRINRMPLEKLLLTLEDRKQESIKGSEAFALLDEILEEVQFTPDDIESHTSWFSSIVPFDIGKLYESTTPAPAAPVVEKKQAPAPAKVVEAEPVQKPVQGTLYEQYAKPQGTTLVDDFQKRRKIKDSLTINQKFMFTKILFNGDFELFSAAIDRLDDLDNLQQAKAFLENNYSEWNKEGEEYIEFIEMVERRFGA